MRIPAAPGNLEVADFCGSSTGFGALAFGDGELDSIQKVCPVDASSAERSLINAAFAACGGVRKSCNRDYEFCA